MIINSGCIYTALDGTAVDLSEDIRWTDPHRHKYDSAMAEYLDRVGDDDEFTGDAEWHECVQRFGKRLLFTDDRGFVTCEKYPTVDAAQSRFDEINAEYSEWLDEESDYGNSGLPYA